MFWDLKKMKKLTYFNVLGDLSLKLGGIQQQEYKNEN